MTTAYTSILKLALPVTGELDGTWGDVVNNNITSMVEEAVAGLANITTWTLAEHTLTTANGTTSESRCAMLALAGSPGADCTVIVPAASKIYLVKNSTGYTATVKVTGLTGVQIPNGSTMWVYCNGTDVVNALVAPIIDSPILTGTPIADTALTGTNTVQLATTAFVQNTAASYAPLASPALTGTPTVPTAAPGTSTTQTASTAFVQAANAFYAPLASPTFTGTPQAPTPTAGDSSTKIATTAFAAGLAFAAALPAQAGNSGKFVTTDGATASWDEVYPAQAGNAGQFLQTNGTTTSWADAKVANVVTATTATTLTSTPTLLKITPTSYGVTVTLPDATTCSVGGPLHIIDNRGAYPVRVADSTGTLKGFIFAGVVSHISLDDNTTAAGVWAIENSELVGASAQLLTTNLTAIESCVSLDADREFLLGRGGSSHSYGVVYNKTTNTFGAVTLIRGAATLGKHAAIKSATDQILVVSCQTSAAAFEAVTLSISGTTITVNTAATATLSANIAAFADGCRLIAVGSSFVTSYTVATPAAQIRALSISGTTVTIGSATALDGTTAGLIANATTGVVAASATAGVIYHKYYGISGTTITTGSGGSFGTISGDVICLAAMASGRWFLGYSQTTANTSNACFVSLSGTTTSVINRVVAGTANATLNAFILSATKVFVSDNNTTNNNNIVTDSAGTASLGTAITNNSTSGAIALYLDGDTLYCGGIASTSIVVSAVNVSGASPVLSDAITIGENTTMGSLGVVRNSVLSNSPYLIFGTQFVQSISSTLGLLPGVTKGVTFVKVRPGSKYGGYRGKADSERWYADTYSITKTECAL